MSESTITVELAPQLALRREKRKPWSFNYRDKDGFGFGGYGTKGGITKAKSFAKQLKRKMNTDPEIIISEKHKD